MEKLLKQFLSQRGTVLTLTLVNRPDGTIDIQSEIKLLNDSQNAENAAVFEGKQSDIASNDIISTMSSEEKSAFFKDKWLEAVELRKQNKMEQAYAKFQECYKFTQSENQKNKVQQWLDYLKPSGTQHPASDREAI